MEHPAVHLLAEHFAAQRVHQRWIRRLDLRHQLRQPRPQHAVRATLDVLEQRHGDRRDHPRSLREGSDRRAGVAPSFLQVRDHRGTATSLSITASIEGADTYSDGRVEKDGQRYVRQTYWAKWDGATPVTVLATLKQNFGTGGSPSAAVPTTVGNATLTSAWKQFSFFVALPSVAGKNFGTNADDTLGLELTMPLTVGELSIAQFKIEPGTQHSRYIRRDIAEEEHLCSRYVQSVTAQIGTTDTVLAFRPMAKNPTVSGGGTGFAINAIGPSHIRALQTTAGMQTLLLRAE